MGAAALNLKVEARHDERTDVFETIDMYSEHNFWSGLTMNMSEGGVFVATHKEVPVGTILVVEMELPGEEQPLVSLAEVRWSRAYNGDSDVPPGLGLQFVDLDDASLARVRRFVDSVRDPLLFED